MGNNKGIAAKLLSDAGKAVLRDRNDTHGPTEASFEMIGELWTVYLRHARRVRQSDSVSAVDVAQMLSMLKKARSMYGDKYNEDNFADDIGYSALAGMLQLSDAEDEHIHDRVNHLKEALEDATQTVIPHKGDPRDN